jgi:hypothetical protein
MSDDRAQSIKTEITFFMDKLFQSSFVYVGALFATLATIRLDGSAAIGALLGVSPRVIVVVAVLLANLVFLVLACSCTFAVLKRGMFIIEYDESNASAHSVLWEAFVRRTRLGWGELSWNVDNYYVAVLGIVVFGVSLALGVIGLRNPVSDERWIVAILLALHVLPLWMLWQVARMNAACRRVIQSRQSEPKDDCA